MVTTSGRTGWTLTTASGVPVEPVEQFLRHRFNSEASPNTLKAYAHDLKHFFTFLGEQQLDWRQVTQSAAFVEEQHSPGGVATCSNSREAATPRP